MKFFILLLMFSAQGMAAEFAITMDDPRVEAAPTMSALEIDQKILDQLDDLKTKAALFVCGKRVDSRPGRALLERWDKKGHLIGNHTYSHAYYHSSKMTFERYSSDILKVEKQISQLKNFRKVFRYPYLKSGESKEKRDRLRAFLKQNGYRHGYVTVDASDWYIAERLEKRLQTNPQADLSGFKKFYLDHMWQRALYYDQLATKVFARPIKHTLLIHHNLLNALFLKDLVLHFQSKGWKLINAKEALADSLYELEPNTLPAGEGIIWAAAKAAGEKKLRYPAEDSRYEQEQMNLLGL